MNKIPIFYIYYGSTWSELIQRFSLNIDPFPFVRYSGTRATKLEPISQIHLVICFCR